MDFGEALRIIKAGGRVARRGWNGRGMFLFLVPGSTFKVNRPPLLGIYPEGTEIRYHAHIDMRTADGQVVPWLCSQTDALAEDWEEILAMSAGVLTAPAVPAGCTLAATIPIASMDGATAVAGQSTMVHGAKMTPISIGVGGSAPLRG